MSAEDLAPFVCQECGKAFRPKPQLVGRRVRCPCGGLVNTGTAETAPSPTAKPAVIAAAGADAERLGRKPQEAALKARQSAPPLAAAGAVAIEPAATPPANSDSDTYGMAPGPEPIWLAPPSFDHLPPVIVETVVDPTDDADDQSASSEDEASSADDSSASDADDEDALLRPSVLHDWVIPTAMIFVGVVLAWLEVTRYTTHPASEVGAIVSAIGFKLILACALILGGMYLAAMFVEVTFIGPLWGTIYKLIGVAIGCAAIYGILSYAPASAASTAASTAAIGGTFAALAAYFVSYKFVLRLNVRDASICTLITIILVSLANYFAYKLEGATSGAWF
jgi:hypothetical protein